MEDTVIIGISGKKQAGKDTIIRDYIDNNSDIYDVRQYSFADIFKRKICIDILGLTEKQVYGSDKEKNYLTKYRWENMPIDIRTNNANQYSILSDGLPFGVYRWEDLPKDVRDKQEYYNIPRCGPMTAREIMQVAATDIFRNYFDNNIWVESLMRKIFKEKPKVALISDVRFEGEADSILKNNGYVIRLTRNICNNDKHPSETALDNYNFEKDNCYILDNAFMSKEEQYEKFLDIINQILKFGIENE